MNFSSPDDMLTHSETQTKLTSILQITLYISLNLLTNKCRNSLKPICNLFKLVENKMKICSP